MRRTFERNLLVNHNGTTSHVPCIDHCLLYAFGECEQIHTSRCDSCKDFFDFFDFLYEHILEEHKIILNEIKEKLRYFLAHQARKVYLNTQYKAALASLDNNGAVMIADYKMRILPQSARETKEQFFGKRGWTLHTILVFIKNEIEIEVLAFDHWSTDTKQDSWFTASSFEVVFQTLSKKLKWVKILSDNGPHYHNSQLMAIVAHWNEWYDIEVKSWQFFEPGEAKTTIDSHHAAVSYLNKLLFL